VRSACERVALIGYWLLETETLVLDGDARGTYDCAKEGGGWGLFLFLFACLRRKTSRSLSSLTPCAFRVSRSITLHTHTHSPHTTAPQPRFTICN